MESHWGTSSYYGFEGSTTNALYIVNSTPMQVLSVGVCRLANQTPTPHTTTEPTNPVVDPSTKSTKTSSVTSTDSSTTTSESSSDANSNVATDSATEPSDVSDTVTDSEVSSSLETKDKAEVAIEESTPEVLSGK